MGSRRSLSIRTPRFGHFFLEDVLDLAGKPEEAMSRLNKAIRLDPLIEISIQSN